MELRPSDALGEHTGEGAAEGNNMKTVAIILIYVICWIGTAGAMLAFNQHRFPTLACNEYRQELGFFVGWSMVPVLSPLLALFITDFYEHGWTLSRPEGCYAT